jgi:Ca2+-binding RTX toxin-like protein
MGDFDEDGDLDLSSANFGSNTASILINTGAIYSLTRATSAREGTPPDAGGELVFTVRRTATSEAENVTYSLGGSASGGDYAAPSGTVHFAAGHKTAKIHISIDPDRRYEHDETVKVTLTGASGEGTINAARDSLRATIKNDDPLNGTSHDDNLTGSNSGETINGKAGDDLIAGKGGNDHIFGDGGDDRIHGGEGSDIIRGGGGKDRLFGDDGKDHIFSGTGRDVMTGGGGDDLFVFTSIEESAPSARLRDVIDDFKHGHDRIDLSEIDADSGRGGNQAFSWHGSSSFSEGKAGWLIAEKIDRSGTAHDETVISGDVNGDARADFQIELTGLKTLNAGDFLL